MRGKRPDENREGNVRRKELLVPLLSALLGLLSVAALLRLAAGVPAIVFGVLALRRLNAAPDPDNPTRLWGKRLALGGVALGAAGSVLGVIALVSMGLLRLGEAGRKTTCADNLRRIGLAVQGHHDLGAYPRAVVERQPRPELMLAPWLGDPYSSRLSWMVEILPFLDQPGLKKSQGRFAALFEKFDRERAWDDSVNREGINTSVRAFLCASHPHFDPQHRPALTSYVGIAGVGADAVELPLESRQAGFFGYERRLRRKDLVTGESYTLLATETTLDNGPWAAGGWPTVRGLDPATRPYIGVGRPFGGLHPGGANLLMADASVRFFTTKGSPELLESLATLADDTLPED